MNTDLLSWFDDLLTEMREPGNKLGRWADVLPDQLNQILHEKPHGDQQRWSDALAMLPDIENLQADIQTGRIEIRSDDISAEQEEQVLAAAKGLIPWRKGPFQFFDTHIDTEWRSDWKWDRIASHLAPMKDRLVLDVGCGSGYHMWRMLGDGAYRVIGVDPSRLFLMQFQAFKQYAEKASVSGKAPQKQNIDLLPLRMEDVPRNLQAFDTTFSMGVLYHRKSPIEHIQELKSTLKPGGQLVLETLVIEGELGEALMPEDRYAQMRNVWFLPSCETLKLWARRAGLKNPRIVDLNQTSIDEQRGTDWMLYNSLEDFLDPDDHNKTIEGYPAPLRATLIAEA